MPTASACSGDAMGLLDCSASPPPAALVADPLTIAEIDAHPDSARLWATILAMREEHDGTPGAQAAAHEDGYIEGYDEARRAYENADG